MISNKLIKRMFEPSVPNGKVPLARRFYVPVPVGLSFEQPYAQLPGNPIDPQYPSDIWAWQDTCIAISNTGKVTVSRKTNNAAYVIQNSSEILWF